MVDKSDSCNKKIKVVVTDTAVLYPPNWGGPKRIWNLFGNFSKELFNMDYVGLDLSHIGRAYKVKKISPNFREFLSGLPNFSKIWDFLEGLYLQDLSLPLFSYLMPNTVKEFKYIYKNLDKDIIVSSHPWAGICVEKDNSSLFVYDAHNCEYSLMKRLVKENLLGKIISKRTKIIEKEVCRKSDIILVCSEEDKESFKRIYGIEDNKFRIIPNGTSIKPQFSSKEKSEAKRLLQLDHSKPAILFIGSYYKPNVEAAEFVVKELAPNLKNFNFIIGGSVKNNFIRKEVNSNIKLYPEVESRCSNEEIGLLLKASDVAVNPIFSGSGTSIKLLDYLSSGTPTVTTFIGKRGFNFNNMEEVYSTTQSNFPKAIIEILENKELYDKLSEAGRRVVLRNYSWKKISEKLEKVIIEDYNNN